MFALLLGRWGAEALGPRGAVLAAFGAGLADAHAGSVAAASLAAKGDITVTTALGAVAGIFLGWPMASIQLAAFAGGTTAVGLVWVVSARLRGADRTLTLILCGIAVGSLLSAGVALFKYVADPGSQLPAITFWLLGSLTDRRDVMIRTAPWGGCARSGSPALACIRCFLASGFRSAPGFPMLRAISARRCGARGR